MSHGDWDMTAYFPAFGGEEYRAFRAGLAADVASWGDRLEAAGEVGPSEEWAELLRDVPRVVLVVDGDEAGQKWAMSVAASVKARLGVRWFDDHLDAVACPAEMDAADLLARGEEELAETIGVRLPW